MNLKVALKLALSRDYILVLKKVHNPDPLMIKEIWYEGN